MSRWNTVTETDPKPDPSLIEFSLTPQDRDVVQIARCEIHAFKHGQFVPGLVVTHLTKDDLTDSEKAAFGMGVTK